MHKLTSHARRALASRAYISEAELLLRLDEGYGVAVATEGGRDHVVIWDGANGLMPVVDPKDGTVVTVLHPDFNCRTGALTTRALSISQAKVEQADPSVELWDVMAHHNGKDSKVGEHFGTTQGDEAAIALQAMGNPKILELFQKRNQYFPCWIQTYTGKVVLLWDAKATYWKDKKIQQDLWANAEPAALAKRMKKMLNKGQPWVNVMATLHEYVPDPARREAILAHI